MRLVRLRRWKRLQCGEVQRWEVSGFIQGWGMHRESKILPFCFSCRSRKRRDEIGLRSFA